MIGEMIEEDTSVRVYRGGYCNGLLSPKTKKSGERSFVFWSLIVSDGGASQSFPCQGNKLPHYLQVPVGSE